MGKRIFSSKRRTFIIFFPIILILFFMTAYGALQNYVRFESNLRTSEKPSIEVNSFINRRSNNVILNVESATMKIQDINPNPLLTFIKITNNGVTPITKLDVNNVYSKDWELVEIYIEANKNTVPINLNYISILNYSTTYNLNFTLSDLKEVVGKHLTPNETMYIILKLRYTQIGNQAQPEYRYSPPIYTNTATITAYITGWQGQPKTDNLFFTTDIDWYT